MIFFNDGGRVEFDIEKKQVNTHIVSITISSFIKELIGVVY